MKKIKRILVFIIFPGLLFLSSCSKSNDTKIDLVENEEQVEENTGPEEQPEEVSYFTFSIGEVEFSDGTENWLILHDENGELLDFMSYSSEEILEFTKRSDSLPNSLTVTLFSHSISPIPNTETVNHSISTFTDIAVNSNWEIFMGSSGSSDDDENQMTESFKFTLNGISAPHDPSSNLFSSKNGLINNSYNITDDNSGVLTYEYNAVPIRDEADDFIYSRIDNNQNLKYYFLENVEDGSEIELDYSDFSFYDDYLDIPFEGSNFYEVNIEAYEDTQSFLPLPGFRGYQLLKINSAMSQIENPFIRPGFLDRFTNYRTEIKLNKGNNLYHFLLYGEKPIEVGPPANLDFMIIDDSLKDFQFETSIPYVRKRVNFFTVSFTENALTTWNFSSNNNKNPSIEIPIEIISRYPKIDIEGLKYSYVDLFINFSKTYQELIEEYEDNNNDNVIESFEKIRFNN